jgi:hypothetical protein
MLKELEGSGWTVVEPPLERDGESVIARCNDEKIKAGFLMEVKEETDSLFHAQYRSGCYDLDVKIDFDIGRGLVKVNKAEGYAFAD